jgi:predicted small secreted protein
LIKTGSSLGQGFCAIGNCRMKAIILFSTLLACSIFMTGCSSTMNGPAGAGTSQTSAAGGGPGHGPEGAMNGNNP